MWDVLSGVAEVAWDVLSGAAKMAWDVLSGVTKTAWDVLSGVANCCGMFCPGWQKMAWDVLSRDVLSYILSPHDAIRRPGIVGFLGHNHLLWEILAPRLLNLFHAQFSRAQNLSCSEMLKSQQLLAF